MEGRLLGHGRIGDTVFDPAVAGGNASDESPDGIGIGSIDPLGKEPIGMPRGQRRERGRARPGKRGHAVAAIEQSLDDCQSQTTRAARND